MKIKVTVISAFEKPSEHFFDDWGNAEEFALAMREQQYKTVVEELDSHLRFRYTLDNE